MNPKRLFLLSALLLFVISFAALRLPAQTQTTGEITGVVTDPSGAVVAKAKVMLKDNSKGSTQSVETNKEGVYRFQLLNPSNYTITVTSSGFQESGTVVDVALGQVTSADIQLTIGPASQTVTVAGESEPLIQTENGNVATTFSQQQLAQVPNPGNDLTAFIQSAPGVVMNTAGGLGNFSDHGVGAASNLFTLNGMDDNDPFLNLNNSGATNLLLGANEVQESTIVSTGYSAEYGSLAGANVNYVTKSGSNDFHGNAIYYWNGSAFNANDWFLNHAGDPKNFSNANQWAGSFGGPIKKDKAFFFFNTEGLRVVVPVSTAVAFPSQAFQTATIANLENKDGFPANSATVAFYQNTFNLYNNAKGAANAVPGAGPLSTDPLGCNGFTGLGPGVACSSFFQAADNNLTHEQQFAGRVDYNATSNDRLFLRILYDKGVQASDTDPISPLFNITSTQPQWQGQLNETHTFGSTMVNEFILSGQWYSAVFDNTNRAATLAAFPTTIAFGNANIPWFNIGGAAAGGAGDAFFPQGRNVTQYQIGDDLSKTLGNHTLKFGTKFLRYDVSDKDFGVFTSGLITPNSVAAFFNGGVDPATGTSSVLQQSFPSALSQPIALYTLAFYGEDDWKIKSDLTLTFALRVEHESNPVCQTDCFNRLNAPFLLADNNVNVPYSTDVLQGLHQELQGLSSILWQPRFGFAWSPRGSRSTVIRGGMGLFNDAFPAVFTDNFASNAPGVNTFVVAGSNIAPGETLNGGNLFAQAAASNVGLINGFKNNETLAQIQANVPNFAPPSLFSANKETKIAQFQKWSLEIQQALGKNSSFDVSYNGNHSIHDLVDRNGVNAFCTPGVGACATVPAFVGLPAAPFDPRFGTVSLLDTNGISNYEGVTFSFKHNINGGWGKGVLFANYTYSHAFDDVSNGGDPNVFFSGTSVTEAVNPFNIHDNYGPSDYDVRNYFNASYVWELPLRRVLLGHGWAPLVDGWQVSGTIFARSGLPYSVVDGGLDGILSAQNFGGVVLPQFLGGPTSNCGEGAATGVTPCLTVAQFVPSGTEKNFVGGLRNIFRGPDYWNTDFTAQKLTKIPRWEKGEFGVAFQFFNLFNHPNFNLPNNDLTGALGSISSAVSEPTSILGSGLGGDASVRIIQIKTSLTF
jgi:Carboxypeptidase regulatory-like domain/TonB-dependent Receptor Plug Domain